jgi:hypothetical protein
MRGLTAAHSGDVVALGRTLDRSVPGFEHYMLYDAHTPRAAQDLIVVRPHGYAVTHIDALAHGFMTVPSTTGDARTRSSRPPVSDSTLLSLSPVAR